MAYKEISKYSLTYSDHPAVWVTLIGENYSHLILPAPSDAVFVADMLRNEKPVYYDPDRKVLSTHSEEVGEEET
jgi:hypothetical protein